MLRLNSRICLALALCGLLTAPACAQPAASTPRPETPERRPFLMRLFGRPAKPTPLTQMAHGLILEAQGNPRQAIQAYADLTRIWPRSKQAPEAQFRRAQLLFARGDLMDAFNAYTELLELYSARYPYEQVLENQFLIARRILDMRHARWFFGIGF
ncbi:MAG: tetratricopeptide repeat protein, partial [Candidatus Marinimicrobia bacterium]|nr:tetratricopeptide repeat protein [Candidatus Neomarinimicrobiota bacterium]